MKFHTNISGEKDGEHHIYGKKVTEIMKTHTFTDVIFLLYAGKLPSRGARADRKSTRLNSSHIQKSRMPSSA